MISMEFCCHGVL